MNSYVGAAFPPRHFASWESFSGLYDELQVALRAPFFLPMYF